jgi:glycosyltransferase involved in cell wall biosynthesis
MDNNIKVLEISIRSDHGGGPVHVLSLLKGLRNKFEFFVAAPKGAFYLEFKKYSSKIIKIPERRFSVLYLIYIYIIVKKYNINIIHSHGRGAGIYSRSIKFISNKVFVIHTHHGFYLNSKILFINLLKIKVEIFLSKFTDYYIALSDSEIINLKHHSIYFKDKTVKIENGIVFKDVKKIINSKNLVKIILVTRLEVEKGNDLSIDILSKLTKMESNFEVMIVGDGPQKKYLIDKVNRLNLTHYIKFLGFRDDISDLLNESDIFFSASNGEAHPLSLIEAISFKLPIVASNVLGHVDVVSHDFNGYLFDRNDIFNAARYLKLLINSPKLRRDFGENGYQKFNTDLSLDKMLSRISELYCLSYKSNLIKN